jgi:threonine synthase
MKYKSTRGKQTDISFENTLFYGLAEDGGLFIPNNIPKIDNLNDLKNLSFSDLAFKIFREYIDISEISNNDLQNILKKSFSVFNSSLVTPLVKLEDNFYILELFHGPTFSFKDIALQVVGNLFEYFIKKNKRRGITIIAATSGDTGSAAINAVYKREKIEAYILHPNNKISNIQKAQMTTIYDDNIHNLAIEGNFDDCQEIVKKLFMDLKFKQEKNLVAINSINWVRILTQIVYYFYAYFQTGLFNKINFSVPTGNFGNILAGFYALKMGLPINKLIIATHNKNDTIYRFIKEKCFSKRENNEDTYTPSMDVSIPSNFERLLWYLLYETNTQNTSEILKLLMINKSFIVYRNTIEQMEKYFICNKITNEQIIETIEKIYIKYNYIIDPHTAVGVCSKIDNFPTVCLATAHPGKFPETIVNAINIKEDKFIPIELHNICSLEQMYTVLDNSVQEVKNFITSKNIIIISTEPYII